jgi:hypothetical protein
MKHLETAFAQAQLRTESLHFLIQTIQSRQDKLETFVTSLESVITKL